MDVEDIFCTPMQKKPHRSFSKLSLSQSKKKANKDETLIQTDLTPRKIENFQRPSCLSRPFDCKTLDFTPLSQDRPNQLVESAHTQEIYCEIRDDRNEKVSSLNPVSVPVEPVIQETINIPRIKVRSLADLCLPKSEDTDVIVLSSDEEYTPIKKSPVKSQTSIKSETTKKKLRTKKSDITTKIEVKRRLTKSTNLKNFPSKYLDSSQKRIDNFFSVEKNPKSVGYYETFKKSEVKDFEAHSSHVADYSAVVMEELERMKESSSRIVLEISPNEILINNTETSCGGTVDPIVNFAGVKDDIPVDGKENDLSSSLQSNPTEIYSGDSTFNHINSKKERKPQEGKNTFALNKGLLEISLATSNGPSLPSSTSIVVAATKNTNNDVNLRQVVVECNNDVSGVESNNEYITNGSLTLENQQSLVTNSQEEANLAKHAPNTIDAPPIVDSLKSMEKKSYTKTRKLATEAKKLKNGKLSKSKKCTPVIKKNLNMESESSSMSCFEATNSSDNPNESKGYCIRSDHSNLVLTRYPRACKRLSFTSSSTCRNLISQNGAQSSSTRNDSFDMRSTLANISSSNQDSKKSRNRIKKTLEKKSEELENNAMFSDDPKLVKTRLQTSRKRLNYCSSPTTYNSIPQNSTQISKNTTNSLDTSILMNIKSPLKEIPEIDLTTLDSTPESKKFKTPRTTIVKSKKRLTNDSHRKTMSQTSKKKKRNGPKECPSYKIIEGTTFAVDGFRFGDIEGVTHYFLTHFHADHYIGLKKSFCKPIYLSVITSKLVETFIGTDKQFLNPVEIEKPFIVNDIEIIAIDANHCPGAAMFLFKFSTGLCTLHTGDFRASADMEEGPVFWNNTIHTIYLDTTYLSSKYDFKPQSESISDALEAIRQFKSKHIGEKILYVCGSYVIGKEKVWMAIAEENNLLVWSEENRRKALNSIGDKRMLKYLIDDPREANLHILTLGKLGYDYLSQYLNQFTDQYSILVAIRPSGWEKNSRPQYRGRINIIGIEYSEHSSYNELRRFVRFLQPYKIISTVPESSDLSQTVQIPNSWYNNEIRSQRKSYQTSLTNYIKTSKKKRKPKMIDYPSVSSNSSDDVGMLDATQNSIKNQQINLSETDYMS